MDREVYYPVAYVGFFPIRQAVTMLFPGWFSPDVALLMLSVAGFTP
jgi:hypothetical protein